MRALVGMIFLLSLSTTALADDVLSTSLSKDDWKTVHIVRSKKTKENLQGLGWESNTLQATSTVDGGSFIPMVKIEGTFAREDWILVKGETPINIDPKTSTFTLDVPLFGEVTPVHLYGIGPMGEVEDEKLVLTFPRWNEYGEKLKELKVIKPAILTGLGISTISYGQTGVTDFTQKAITFKAGYQGLWKAPWDYGFSTYLTVLPFGSSQPGTSARFFGLNGRIGYALPYLKEPWRLSLMAGGYYTTMFVTGGSFGYKNVGGPMVYPVLRRILSARDTVSGYFKFSPISDGIGFLSMDSRELAFGAAWTRQEPGVRPFSISFDFADTAIVVLGAKSQAKSISLGFAYGW